MSTFSHNFINLDFQNVSNLYICLRVKSLLSEFIQNYFTLGLITLYIVILLNYYIIDKSLNQ
jgi:hypothetical protein